MTNILTIAGSDSSSGAGIQADLKTISSLGGYGVCTITAITSQNSQGVIHTKVLPVDIVEKQLDAILSDIKIDVIKIGMLGSKEIVSMLSHKLKKLTIPIVLDTVILSSSGYRLLENDALDLMKNELFPISSLITPNIKEAEMLSGLKIENKDDMRKAIQHIKADNILLKGGHLKTDALDILFQRDYNSYEEFTAKRVVFDEVHGTGCTLSSAIATFLSKNYDLFRSVHLAKKYISGAIKHSFDIGYGSKYINHFYKVKNV